MMKIAGRTKGGRKGPAQLIRAIVAFIGLMLSPLTPWNDSFVNIPLSILIAEILRPIMGFDKGYWFGYFLTNALGIFLLLLASKDDLKKIKPKDLVQSFIIALIVYLLLHWFLHV